MNRGTTQNKFDKKLDTTDPEGVPRQKEIAFLAATSSPPKLVSAEEQKLLHDRHTSVPSASSSASRVDREADAGCPLIVIKTMKDSTCYLAV